MSSTVVNPRRVAECLLASRNLFGPTGRFWTKGELKIEDEVKRGMFDYCAAGAIRNVPGFTDDERWAAERALAELISKESDYSLLDDYDADEVPGIAAVEEVIFDANDNEDTTFADVRRWFTSAAARLKRS
jgi:hypothetical protein